MSKTGGRTFKRRWPTPSRKTSHLNWQRNRSRDPGLTQPQGVHYERNKDSTCRKAKRSGTQGDWVQNKKFGCALDRQISKKQRDRICIWDYRCLPRSDKSKPFWNYVKSLNLTSFGISTLTLRKGETVFTLQANDNVLTHRFQSVFTEENIDNMTTETRTCPSVRPQ